MSTTQTEFEQLEATLDQAGVEGVLSALADKFREEKRYHELFEIRKMQVRRELGLPVLYSDNGDDLPETLRTQLEEGLLSACREVGSGLLQQGKAREGWMYFRPVGDRETVRQALAKIEVDDDNMDEIIEVMLHEGVDVAGGYDLVLKNYGTCNAITTFESVVPHHSRADQQAAAALLVRHIHQELTDSLIADIGRQEGQTPARAPLQELVAERDWLFTEYSYHLDTTHLASAVRIARLLEEPADLRLALDLTHYGRHLASQFQYQGDEPFADLYPSHGLYFQALLGENVEQALEYFRQKAENVDRQEYGTVAIEVYADLLHRVGRSDQAMQVLIAMMPEGARPRGIAPSLFQLSQATGKFAALRDYCRDRNDLLGFATALVCSRDSHAE